MNKKILVSLAGAALLSFGLGTNLPYLFFALSKIGNYFIRYLDAATCS